VIDDQDPDRRADIREAGAFDTLERWGRQLDDEYASADLGDYVDDNLRYQAAPLARYGAWVTINGGHYWRPRVDASWRPYWHGRWVYTPAGMTWVSSEPWGWVPYHYGSWDYVPDYGWVWQPGYVWSPAWVYWYWGPSYVGWCPTGYYTRYYGPEFGADIGFRWGVYGWAGGNWDLFDRWSFVSTSYFDYRAGYRQGYRDGYWDAHRDVQRFAIPIDRHGRQAIERGIITTDTKPLKPSVFRDRGEVLQVLRGGHQGELQDVTLFVARTPKPKLPPAVITSVVADKPQVLDGTPLRPGTLGKPDRRPRGERSSVFGGEPGKPGVTGAAPGERNPAVGRPAPGDRQVRPGRPGPQADGGAPRSPPGAGRGAVRPERQAGRRPALGAGWPAGRARAARTASHSGGPGGRSAARAPARRSGTALGLRRPAGPAQQAADRGAPASLRGSSARRGAQAPGGPRAEREAGPGGSGQRAEAGAPAAGRPAQARAPGAAGGPGEPAPGAPAGGPGAAAARAAAPARTPAGAASGGAEGGPQAG